MKKLLYLVTLSLVATMVFAPAALAQEQYRSPACEQVQDRVNAGDDSLTTAELLSCGISPEVFSPCEGNPDPSCAANNPPGVSFGGPNGVRANDTQNCGSLPEGSPESIACYEELVADLTGSSPAPAQTTQYTPPTTTAPTATTPTTATEAFDEETPSTTTTTPLPDTGGISLLVPASLLLASGLIGLGLMRRK